MTPCKTCSKPASAAGAKTPINAKLTVDLRAGSSHADQPPATSHQPPATSHQPPATSHQPPATSHQPSASDHHAPAAISHLRSTPPQPSHSGDHRPPATKPPSVNTFWPLIIVQRPAASVLDPRSSCNGAKARITRLPSPAALRCPPHEMQPGAPFIGHPNHTFPRVTQNTRPPPKKTRARKPMAANPAPKPTPTPHAITRQIIAHPAIVCPGIACPGNRLFQHARYDAPRIKPDACCCRTA